MRAPVERGSPLFAVEDVRDEKVGWRMSREGTEDAHHRVMQA
jgi:hypothetical protein